MEELINIVVEKTGLPEEQAKMAVDAVLDFVKDKLPEPIAAQVEIGKKGVHSGERTPFLV